MQNHSITAYTDNVPTEVILEGLQMLGLGEVIVNGIPTKHALNGRPTQLFTFVKISEQAWKKVKARKFVKTLKSTGNIQTWV